MHGARGQARSPCRHLRLKSLDRRERGSRHVASVTIEAVRKSYGATEVVHGVDVSIDDGEFCVLVGPSGCGKSTLLRMIAGLEEITAGRILIGERVVNDVPAKDRDLAQVFQHYARYPHQQGHANTTLSVRKRVR